VGSETLGRPQDAFVRLALTMLPDVDTERDLREFASLFGGPVRMARSPDGEPGAGFDVPR